MTKTLTVLPPSLPDGVNRSTYRLQIDLYQISTSSWFAAKGNQPKENPVIINKKLMADALGLERYYHYVGADLGAGMQQLTNVANGNSVIRWTPFTSKGRGLSTVVNLTYNSLEGHSKSPACNNVSLSISSLIPFGSQLDIHPNKSDVKAGRTNKYVEFVDGDGTPHHFDLVANDVYAEPPGVHLYLRKKNPTGDQTWAITRPDRVTFYFRDDGFPTQVVDKNGNTLTFTLEQTPPGQDPGGPKFRITQVTDAGGRAFTVSYYSKNEYKKAHVRGKVSTVTDHQGHALEFQYYKDGNLLRLTQKGGTNADGSFLPDRTFVITYMDSAVVDPVIPNRADRDNPDPNTSPQSSVIFSMRDPRGNESTFRYCTPSGPNACTPDASKNKGKLRYRYDRPGESVTGTPRTELAYNITTRVTTVTAPLSRVTSYAYDTDGRVTSITDALSRITSLTWSTDFQMTILDEPGDPKTTFTYNENGYLTQRSVLTDRQGQTDVWSTTALDYQNIAADAADVSGNWRQGRTIPHLSQLITKTDPNGTATPTPTDDHQWAFTYDPQGNLTSVIEPERYPGPRYTTTYTWNPNGTLASITDADSHPATTFDSYDANGLPTQVTDGAGQVTKFGYDSDAQLLWIQDPLHAADTGSKPREYRTYFDYDSFHRLGRQSTPKSTRFDRGRLVWSSTDYDPNDNVVAIMAPHYGSDDGKNGAKTTIAYDVMDRRTLVTGPDKSYDPAGERTKYDYDDAGRVTRVTLPQGMFSTGQSQDFVIDSAYDLLDRVIKQTRYNQKPDNSIENLNTHFCYDTNGDLVRVTAPRAGLESVDCSAPQPPAFTRTYTYWFDHKLKSQADPLGHTKSFAYDLNRNLITTTDENGQPETRLYDQRNLLIQIDQQFTHAPDPSRKVTTKFGYDGVGNRTKLWSPRASDANNGDYVTSYAYDNANRLNKVTLPHATGFTQYYVEHGYDANGNLTCTSLPVATDVTCGSLGGSSKTVMDYFDPGWIERTDDPGNAVPPALFDYRAEGWQTSRIPEGDPSFEVDWAYYDDGTLKEVSEQKTGNPSTYSYDADNNLLQAKAQSVIYPNLVVTVQGTYDWLDRVTKARAKKTPDTNWKATLFTYDLNSNVATREDNRVENDAGGQVNPGRIYAFTYDQADWLSAQTDDRGTAGDCTDDAKITNTFLPTGWEQTRKFFRVQTGCDLTLLKQQTDWTYFDNGKVKSVDTQAKQSGQMVSVEHHDVTFIDVLTNQYVNGNRVKDTFTLKGPNTVCNPSTCSSTYTYDPRDKLIKEVKVRDATTTVEYGLDPDGNILSITTNGSPTKSFTYTGDQLATVTQGGATQKYFYDPRGNLDCITTDQGSPGDCPQTTGKAVPASLLVDYTYDFMNRLTDYAKYANSVKTDWANYANDALSRVDTETEHHPGLTDRTTVFTYVGLTNQVTKEARTEGTDTTTKTYSYDAYGHRVEMTNTPPPGQGSSKDYTYAFDVHGDVSLLVDEGNGIPKESYGYDPYGDTDSQLTQGQGSNDDKGPFNPYRYASKRLDSGSQSYDMGARRFGPDVAHFLQTDLFQGALSNLTLSLDPLTQNRFAIASGNPVDYVEWDGHIVHRDDYAGAAKGPDVVGIIWGVGSNGPRDPNGAEIAAALRAEGFEVRVFPWCFRGGLWGHRCIFRGGDDPQKIAPRLRDWANENNVSVLLGHSKGGLILFEMLAEIGKGRLDPLPNLRRAITVDSPLVGIRATGAGEGPEEQRGLEQGLRALGRVQMTDLISVINQGDPVASPAPKGVREINYVTFETQICSFLVFCNPLPFFHNPLSPFAQHTEPIGDPCATKPIAHLAATGKWMDFPC